MTIIILLSLVGAVLAAVVGTLWYSNATPMGKLHMQSVGFDKLSEAEQKNKIQEMKPKMFKMYGAQIALSLLTSFAVVFIIATSLRNGVSFNLAIGFVLMNWLCFMVPIIGSGILWGNIDRKIAWKKFLSDASSNLVTILLIAFMTSIFV